jgi:hypothetical protein
MLNLFFVPASCCPSCDYGINSGNFSFFRVGKLFLEDLLWGILVDLSWEKWFKLIGKWRKIELKLREFMNYLWEVLLMMIG